MKLTGNFYLENEKIAFLFVVLDFGKKNIYLQYKNKIYDLRYLINKIKYKKSDRKYRIQKEIFQIF